MPAPTFDEIVDAYLTYADWESYRESDQDTAVSRCRLFVTACKRLLLILPKVSETRGQTRAELDPAEIRKELEHARRYLTVAGGDFATDPVRHVNFENFRD